MAFVKGLISHTGVIGHNYKINLIFTMALGQIASPPPHKQGEYG